mgnify:CR=1 FL=1
MKCLFCSDYRAEYQCPRCNKAACSWHRRVMEAEENCRVPVTALPLNAARRRELAEEKPRRMYTVS